MVKISPQGAILSSIKSSFKLYFCHESYKALLPGRAWGRRRLWLLMGCKCARYAKIWLPHTPARVPPSVILPQSRLRRLEGRGSICTCCPAPQGRSVDWGLQADVMNNIIKIPKAVEVVPHADTWAIHRASLLFFSFQFKALGKCQSDQIKK